MRSSLHASSSCLADRVGAADHDVAVVDHLVPRQVVLGLLGARGLADLRLVAGSHRRLGDVAGRIGEARVDVQRAVEEVLGRLAVQRVGLGVGVGDADELGDREAVRVVVLAVRLDPAPVPGDGLADHLVAVVREGAVDEVVLGAEVPRLDRTAAGDPHGWVRLAATGGAPG